MDQPFAFSDQTDVDKRRQGFGIKKRYGAAHDDERVHFLPIRSQHGHAALLQHSWNIKIIHFKANG